MGLLKNFNREQLTLGAAILLGLLLLGWQTTRGKSAAMSGTLNTNERVFSIPRQLPLEFVSPKVESYLQGRNPWEQPVTGRMPVPDIRHPEPRVDGPAIPPFMPLPTFEAFNKNPLPGKLRTLPAAAAAAAPAGLPPQADLDALKAIKDPDAPASFDRRKQLMRPTGDTLVHKVGGGTVEGRLVYENAIEVKIDKVQGTGRQGITIPWSQINMAFPGTDDGVERGWEFEKEYDRRSKKLKDADIDGHLKLAKWARDVAVMYPEARNEYRLAMDLFKKKGDFGPKARDVMAVLGDTLRDLGDYDGALIMYNEFVDAVKGSANETGDLHLRIGDLFRAMGIQERALASYQAAIQLEASRQTPRIALARTQNDLGLEAEALATIGALVGVVGAKVEPEAHIVQGLSLLKQGNAMAAQVSFTAALAVQPDNAEALNGMGVALGLQGLPDAGAKFVAAIKANPYEIRAWLNLGGMFLAAGRPVEAEMLYTQALQRDPDGADACAGLAMVQILKGTPQGATVFFEKGLAIQPKHFFIRYLQGHLALQAGKAQDSLDMATEALQSESNYLPAYYDAAVAYLALAREAQRKAQYGAPEEAPANREKSSTYRINAETLLTIVRDMDPMRLSTYVALGCVYAAQARKDEAEMAFDRGTSPGVFDPLLEYGRGFVQYWFSSGGPKARLDLADSRFSVGATMVSTDPVDKEWIAASKDAQDRIKEWNLKRIFFEDRFDNNQWSATANWTRFEYQNGPQLSFATNRAVIGGAQGKGSQGLITGLERREISRDEFLSFEGTLFLGDMTALEMGISIYTSKPSPPPNETAHGLHLVLVEDRTVATKPVKLFFGQSGAVRARGPVLSGAMVPLATLPGGTTKLRVKIERREDATRTWVFDAFQWDDSKNDWKLLSEKSPIRIPPGNDPSPYILTVWGRSPFDSTKWSFGLDDVRVLISNRRNP